MHFGRCWLPIARPRRSSVLSGVSLCFSLRQHISHHVHFMLSLVSPRKRQKENSKPLSILCIWTQTHQMVCERLCGRLWSELDGKRIRTGHIDIDHAGSRLPWKEFASSTVARSNAQQTGIMKGIQQHQHSTIKESERMDLYFVLPLKSKSALTMKRRRKYLSWIHHNQKRDGQHHRINTIRTVQHYYDTTISLCQDNQPIIFWQKALFNIKTTMTCPIYNSHQNRIMLLMQNNI